MKNIISITILLLLILSCKKDELPVQAHRSGDLTTSTVDMGSRYEYQTYYDLESNTIISQNLKTIWDIGFESTTDGYRIIVNSSKAMFVKNTYTNNFKSITDTIGFNQNKLLDAPSGNLDSTAIGDWKESNYVYIIDRGFNENGQHQGFQKIQCLDVNENHYMIKFSNLKSTDETILQIQKDQDYNFQYLSFETKNSVLVEPHKDLWDLCFTQYTHVFYNPTMTYLVTGCLLNSYNTFAAEDLITPFLSIDYSSVLSYTLSKSIDLIGYDWKKFANGTFTTSSDITYIIKNRNNIYFKLHFIDFYNLSGVKGNPKWEYQKL